MTANERKAHFIWSVVIVFIIQLPLLLYYTTGVVSFFVQVGLFVIVALAVGAVYRVLVNVMHADREAPIPWYASPVVWLGIPVLVLVVYVLMQ